MPEPLRLDDPWETVTWEGAAKANLIAGAEMTFAEKLAWLEEINELARRLSENRRTDGSAQPDLRSEESK